LQNVQEAVGRIGQPPVPKGQDFQYTLTTLGRLVQAEDFADIVFKTGPDGEVTYLKDVSRDDSGARKQVTLGQLEAARVRLRPIVMTTLCFVHRVPPYFATGAGAEMRRSVGTAMLWGAFGVTPFGIFLTPVFFYVIRRFAGHPPITRGRP
jgi:multidrug efflux pump subunit AcrB